MPAESVPGAGPQGLSRLGFLFPVLIVASVVIMIVPLPTAVLDLLLACNITLAVLVLLTAIQVRKPLEFSVFPTLLLGTTLSRLVLNLASTRLILSGGGARGLDAAGEIIRSFGSFVAGGNLAIGLVMFAILVAIQFLVITKGATRISEVAARFTLDGLPGRQLAIDADLSAGLIDRDEAGRRREDLSRQTDFYGAMDGAAKFVRGDALAGIVITFVNLVGGLYVGVVQDGRSLGDAAAIFTTLTIGDGLVSQVPAFLIALAAGFLVTRSSVESNLSADVSKQLLQRPATLFVSGAFLLALSCMGLPMGPLVTLAGGCVLLGFVLQKNENDQLATETSPAEPAPLKEPQPDLFERLHVEPLELELGFGLLKLTRPESGDLLNRVTRMRRELAEELGLILPSVNIHDELRLGRNEYRIRIRGVEAARGTAWPDGQLALETPNTTGQIAGIALESAESLPRARWIEPDQTAQAREYGYRVVEPAIAVMIHFAEVIRAHAGALLTRQHVYDLLDRLKKSAPRLVEEFASDRSSIATLHDVLINLLQERVSIRDLESILEAVAGRHHLRDYPDQLTERVRLALAGSICQQYRDPDTQTLQALTLDVAWERTIQQQIQAQSNDPAAPISEIGPLVRELEHWTERMHASGVPAVLVCESSIRSSLRRAIHGSIPRLAVLSRSEITPTTRLTVFGMLRRTATGHEPHFHLNSTAHSATDPQENSSWQM